MQMGVAGQEDGSGAEPEIIETEEADESQEGAGEGGGEEGGEGEETEVIVQIGEEEPPASEEEAQAAPQWVKELRVERKRLKKENAELRAKLDAGKPDEGSKPTLPPKPKLADFDYDEEAYDRARDEWDGKKREVDAWESTQEQRAKQEQEAAKAVHEKYAKSKQALKVPDFQDAEDEVTAALPVLHQTVLMKYAANPAALVVAIGRNPKELQRLSSIKDPAEFIWQASKLEDKVKVTTRAKGSKPEPEKTVRSGSGAPATSATLDRLRAEADKTGDRSKVAAFLRQQRTPGK